MRSFLVTPRHSSWRFLLVPALLAAAAAHLPVIREHLDEAPYMGVLFIVLTAACILLAATLVSFDTGVVYALAAATCVLAVVGYAATRLVGFPMLADDVGNWFEPLGLISIATESLAALCSVAVLRHVEATATSHVALAA
jgi:hypothetical protein